MNTKHGIIIFCGLIGSSVAPGQETSNTRNSNNVLPMEKSANSIPMESTRSTQSSPTRSHSTQPNVASPLGVPTGIQTTTTQPMDTTQMLEVQNRLTRHGYSIGTPSGVLDPQTEAAIRNFQQKNGIPATGLLDQQTVRALGIPSAQ